ncbi:universal stress protein A-like protein [Telopea speciosissima]|uniref:universal stress protein A-like protein n=1 Tax=Telopea speciosissima TaxID=54955 RepID=UPI001CC7B7FF|nr:universal stress protein A-like protein [Telopea speciosissima]
MAGESSAGGSSCSSGELAEMNNKNNNNNGKKKVVVVGVDDSKESFYSLEWTVENLPMLRKDIQVDDHQSSSAALFKLILVHVKVPAVSILRFSGPGFGDVLPRIEADLKNTASIVTDKVKDFCNQKLITDYEVEVWEGDARNVLCEAVEKHRADILVVGSHGYGIFKRAILGSVSDYCAHHAHCSVMIVKKTSNTNN